MSLSTPLLTPSFDTILIEELRVCNFEDKNAFFRVFANLAKKHKSIPAMSLTLNVYSANLAYRLQSFKRILQEADILRCDGIGVMMASRLLGRPIHQRLANADYFPEFLEFMADQGLSVYLLGAQPGVVEKALQKLETMVRRHSVIGYHHGYLSNQPALNEKVIREINALSPDVVVVGMGMPIQEYWIYNNREKLNVGILFAVGALIDYYGGAQYRCNPFLRKVGLEWFMRLLRYPKRMFGRYVIGNPFFLWRIGKLTLKSRLK